MPSIRFQQFLTTKPDINKLRERHDRLECLVLAGEFKRDTPNRYPEENPVVGVIMPYEIGDYHKYLTLWHYSYDALVLSCNKDLWQGFTSEQQSLLKKCAQEAMSYQKELARSGLEDALNILKEEKGVTITQLSPLQRYAFRRETSPIYNKYANKIGWDLVVAFEKAIQLD